MTIDLSALLQEKVGGALSNYVTGQLGESPSMASKAVALVLPALLGRLAGQSGDASRMTQLFNLVTGPQVDTSFSTVEPSLIERGRQWLSMLFGDSNSVINLLAGRIGMSADNTGSLMAAALPMLLGVLRSQVQTDKLTQPQFVNLLAGQRGFLERVLGSDLATALGLGSAAAAVPAAAATRPAAPVTPAPAPVREAAPQAASGGWMKWLWLALAALAALLLLKFCGQKPAETAIPASAASAETVVVTPVEPPSAPASEPVVVAPMASEPVAPAAPASEAAMPPAADMSASAATGASTEALADDASAVKYENETLSFYFATGKTQIDKMAADAVSADIVAMGKEGKTLVVSGYNDPRGNKAKNEELAKNRAKAVKAYLMEQGVPEAKIDLRKPAQTDGHSGSLAQDRRVDVKAE